MKNYLAAYLKSVDSIAGAQFAKAIVAYQKIFSPGRGFFGMLSVGVCRFYPSCSDYTREALRQYGLLKGSMVSLIRIMRCGPWSTGGIDLIEKKIHAAMRDNG